MQEREAVFLPKTNEPGFRLRPVWLLSQCPEPLCTFHLADTGWGIRLRERTPLRAHTAPNPGACPLGWWGLARWGGGRCLVCEERISVDRSRRLCPKPMGISCPHH